jgi:hypothetical protein
MGSIPGATAILDQQELRRGVFNLKYFSNFVGYITFSDQIKKIWFDHIIEIPVFFQPGFGN